MVMDTSVVSMRLTLRKLARSRRGSRVWHMEREDLAIPANRLAVIVCDMWDRHWSTGASLRVGQLALKIDRFCRRLRDAGALIVHAPSETIGAYRDSPARLRITGYGPAPEPRPVAMPPMPMEPGDGGSDTDDPLAPGTQVWSRQHQAIEINTDLRSDRCNVRPRGPSLRGPRHRHSARDQVHRGFRGADRI
jgi:hypothetical protein